MKTINIKGKEYVEVNERLKYFRANYPKHSLTSEVIEKTDTSILILATIRDEKERAIATGMAEEIKGSTFINKTSYVENCETSAWGRALANFGIGLETAVASADEIQNAISNNNNTPIISKVKETKKRLPTGDFNKDLITIKKSIDAGKSWEDAQKWLESSEHYDKVTLTKFKTSINEN
jgi:hypothetical protein